MVEARLVQELSSQGEELEESIPRVAGPLLPRGVSPFVPSAGTTRHGIFEGDCGEGEGHVQQSFVKTLSGKVDTVDVRTSTEVWYMKEILWLPLGVTVCRWYSVGRRGAAF